ncbi:YsnF/AvaK domain-containing protein [Methylobacterium sp. WSM2598]|uniref:YsnF/AvaK domain-containing protein n=1 Tax=Methylobacterium sp. WSM2598 TaxID=398261 RepID=UPI00038214BC|nr:YsnF/AvaK domain-containing protein [Methylobacterium sp. WSM2598]
MSQTITALFDSRREAEAAIERVVALGVPRTSIRLSPETQSSTTATGTSYDHRRDEGGFWASLKDIFMPDEDRYAYAEGMSRGGTMVIVTAEPGDASRIADVLEGAGAVHMDEREAAWRREGWTGYPAAASGTTATARGATASGTATARTTAATGAATARGGTATGATVGRDETIPVAEERLRVGKRVAEAGRVRVRSYVVETPVQEQVGLREERVHLERRPVDRAPTQADERLFAERTIEAAERAEEAVVSKDVRVKEEIGLRKDVEQRTETVSDKVRRTEVEIEDERDKVTRTGTTDTPTTPRR